MTVAIGRIESLVVAIGTASPPHLAVAVGTGEPTVKSNLLYLAAEDTSQIGPEFVIIKIISAHIVRR